MRKAIALSFALWCAVLVSIVSLLGLYLMGPICAVIWGATGILLAAPSIHDVIEAAWKR
jgi:hypothetical protein